NDETTREHAVGERAGEGDAMEQLIENHLTRVHMKWHRAIRETNHPARLKPIPKIAAVAGNQRSCRDRVADKCREQASRWQKRADDKSLSKLNQVEQQHPEPNLWLQRGCGAKNQPSREILLPFRKVDS